MNKKHERKLSLSRETIQLLTPQRLSAARGGGASKPKDWCVPPAKPTEPKDWCVPPAKPTEPKEWCIRGG